MKTLSGSLRVKNVTERAVCRWCANTGLVVVATRPAVAATVMIGGRRVRMMPPVGAAMEEVGPCPFCEEGGDVEFPTPNVKAEKPVEAGPWGRDGYWRGAATGDVEALYEPDSRTLPLEENRRRWVDLGVSLGLLLRDMPDA